MKKYIAEFLGTYMLVFAGTGAIVVNQQYAGVVTHIGIAITFGLVVMSMIYTFGDISGAHLNPAVTTAFAAAGRFPLTRLAPYVLSQCLGAVAASYTLKCLFPENMRLGGTNPSGSDMQSFIMEFILSFFLMMVILHVAEGNKEKGLFAGIAIGSLVALEAMFAGPVCGASMNPARSLGPAVASQHFAHLWIYMLAPLTGMCMAVPVWTMLATKPGKVPTD